GVLHDRTGQGGNAGLEMAVVDTGLHQRHLDAGFCQAAGHCRARRAASDHDDVRRVHISPSHVSDVTASTALSRAATAPGAPDPDTEFITGVTIGSTPVPVSAFLGRSPVRLIP